MHVVALVFELLSHVAYLPALGLALYAGRGQLAMALTYVIGFSMHYHICLDTPVCVTSLRRAGSFDYVAGYYTGALLAHQLTGVPHDSVSMSMTVIMFTLVTVIDDLYLNYWTFALVTAILLAQILALQPLYGLRSVPYRNPGVQPAVWALMVVSYVLIALPFEPGSYWYNWFHPPWHVTSGLSLFVTMVVLTRPVEIQFKRTYTNGCLPLGFDIHYKLRPRRLIIAEATRLAPYSELLPQNSPYVGSA